MRILVVNQFLSKIINQLCRGNGDALESWCREDYDRCAVVLHAQHPACQPIIETNRPGLFPNPIAGCAQLGILLVGPHRNQFTALVITQARCNPDSLIAHWISCGDRCGWVGRSE
jgi:hypothetical protein